MWSHSRRPSGRAVAGRPAVDDAAPERPDFAEAAREAGETPADGDGEETAVASVADEIDDDDAVAATAGEADDVPVLDDDVAGEGLPGVGALGAGAGSNNEGEDWGINAGRCAGRCGCGPRRAVAAGLRSGFPGRRPGRGRPGRRRCGSGRGARGYRDGGRPAAPQRGRPARRRGGPGIRLQRCRRRSGRWRPAQGMGRQVDAPAMMPARVCAMR